MTHSDAYFQSTAEEGHQWNEILTVVQQELVITKDPILVELPVYPGFINAPTMGEAISLARVALALYFAGHHHPTS